MRAAEKPEAPGNASPFARELQPRPQTSDQSGVAVAIRSETGGLWEASCARVRRQLWRAAIAARSGLWSAYVRWLRWRGPHVAARAALHCAPLLRVRILRALGARVGEGTCIHGPFVLMNAIGDFSHLRIGSDCYLGPDLVVDLTEPVSIGDRVAISASCRIMTHFCVGASRLRAVYPFDSAEVVVGSDAYLGTGAILLHGVAIGEAALVAAGSVVRQPVAPATLVAGVPARGVKTVELP